MANKSLKRKSVSVKRKSTLPKRKRTSLKRKRTSLKRNSVYGGARKGMKRTQTMMIMKDEKDIKDDMDMLLEKMRSVKISEPPKKRKKGEFEKYKKKLMTSIKKMPTIREEKEGGAWGKKK